MSETHEAGNDIARQAREALQGRPPDRPAAAYRERVRGAFVAGALRPPAGLRTIRGLPWWRRWRLALLAPVTAALMLAAVGALNRGPAWEVIGGTADAILVVEDRAIPLRHQADLKLALVGGARVRYTGSEPLDLAAGGQMALQITPGSDLTLPAAAGRWLGRRIRAEVRSGEVRVATGPGFTGAVLEVRTPEAEVLVTGTTLAVICEPAGTCVCVMEGVVEMGAHGAVMEPIPAGRRKFVFVDGRAPEHDDMRPMERMKLGMFRETSRERLR